MWGKREKRKRKKNVDKNDWKWVTSFKSMELLIVLGLCFGAYELLGVFQGCFHYQEHPLPYQPHHHNGNINNNSNSNNNRNSDSIDENDNEDDESESKLDKSRAEIEVVAHRKITKSSSTATVGEEEEEEENLESLERSGPCSCYSTVTEDEFDDDTRTIIRNKNTSIKRKSINNKFSLSTSLMSLNRSDDSNFLFNYLDDVSTNNSNKFSKFKSEIEISETSFSRINSHNNDFRRKKRNFRENFETFVNNSNINNEINECNASVNLDTNQKKIFFISAAS